MAEECSFGIMYNKFSNEIRELLLYKSLKQNLQMITFEPNRAAEAAYESIMHH